MPFILDNSIVCGWFLENQSTAYSDAIAERLEADRAVVPPLWDLKVTKVLRAACLRRQMTAEAAQAVLSEFAALPIGIDRGTPLPSELLALALLFGLGSYDAAYLELALRLQLPIATVDGALRNAALA